MCVHKVFARFFVLLLLLVVGHGSAIKQSMGQPNASAEKVAETRKNAEQGDSDAKNALGVYYFNGNATGIDKNYDEAFKLFFEAAQQGNVNGQHNTGVCYEHGHGTKADYRKAFEYYAKAAKQGDAVAGSNKYRLEHKIEKSMKDLPIAELRKKAEDGDPMARFSLALRYRKNDEIPLDEKDPFYMWVFLASEKGHSRALGLLADSLWEKKKYDDAMNFFKLASEMGDVESQLFVASTAKEGFLFRNDNDYYVPKDRELAFKCYLGAAHSDDVDAQRELGFLYLEKETSPGETNFDLCTQAYDWFVKAAANGDVESQFRIGKGVEKGGARKGGDVEYLIKAAKQDHIRAQIELAQCYYRGRGGLEQDAAKSAFWLRKAAEQGDRLAQCLLGTCYRAGDGVERNREEAIKWYRKSAEQGHRGAEKCLEEMGIR